MEDEPLFEDGFDEHVAFGESPADIGGAFHEEVEGERGGELCTDADGFGEGATVGGFDEQVDIGVGGGGSVGVGAEEDDALRAETVHNRVDVCENVVGRCHFRDEYNTSA